MEDFDNYFEGRRCTLPGSKFSFDTILNVLDGCFTEYSELVFFMTANDLNKIDPAIRKRPSRFKFVENIGNPNEQTRMKIFNNSHLVKSTKGLNLDALLHIKDEIINGTYWTEALARAKEIFTDDMYEKPLESVNLEEEQSDPIRMYGG